MKRQLGPIGKSNGPRRGADPRTTISNEAYLGRRFLLNALERKKPTFPISVDHRDAPDVIIAHGRGVLHLEITEACPPEDGRLFATEKGVRPIADYSDTGTTKAVEDLKRQLQQAIDRTRLNTYSSGRVALLIYPNSEAAQWCHFFVRERPAPFLDGLRIEPFDAVYVFWSDNEIFELMKEQRGGVLMAKKSKHPGGWRTCSRGHKHRGPGPCPVCWPGGAKKKKAK